MIVFGPHPIPQHPQPQLQLLQPLLNAAPIAMPAPNEIAAATATPEG
jgi:hypothetical protein